MMEELISLLELTGADGFNGDTMFGINASFYEESIKPSKGPVALQPECGEDMRHMLLTNGSRANMFETGGTLAYNPLSWNYWGTIGPGVSRWQVRLEKSQVLGHR
jgi:hypothetical protein